MDPIKPGITFAFAYYDIWWYLPPPAVPTPIVMYHYDGLQRYLSDVNLASGRKMLQDRLIFLSPIWWMCPNPKLVQGESTTALNPFGQLPDDAKSLIRSYVDPAPAAPAPVAPAPVAPAPAPARRGGRGRGAAPVPPQVPLRRSQRHPRSA